MKKTRPALIALTAALTLGITACGSEDPAAPVDTPTLSTTTEESATTSADESTPDDTTSSPATQAAEITLEDVLAAIEAAEDEAGGTAYEIDDQDEDGSWEVDVAKGATSIEVDVAADGSATIDEEDDLDDDDRAGLDAAKITLGDAIEAALDEVDGTFDDAELEEEDGRHYWEVSIDTADDDDVEVHVDVVTGKATVDTDDD